MPSISTIGFSTQSVLQLKNAQEQLSFLSEQLSTGKKSSNLADYTLTESRRILDLRGTLAKRESFLNIINTVEPRLKTYDNALTKLEEIGNDALSLINSTENPDAAANEAVSEQMSGFMEQVQFYLNQKVGDRYIFAGDRFGTAPVANLTGLAVPPTDSSTPVSSPTLPTYDTQAPGSSASAYVEDAVNIDDGVALTYGVTSNDPAFQKLVLGMRWAYAAAQDSNNFTTYMGTARTLITDALDDLRGVHGEVVSDVNRLNNTREAHKTFISESKSTISDIQNADSSEVAAKISYMQTQLQASYSVTSIIAKLSLTQYL